jgi:Flp pilus assembly pilin Flp
MRDLNRDDRWQKREHGQATAEYALVMLAAAAVALALIAWVTSSNVLPGFFTSIIEKVTSLANGTPLG